MGDEEKPNVYDSILPGSVETQRSEIHDGLHDSRQLFLLFLIKALNVSGLRWSTTGNDRRIR